MELRVACDEKGSPIVLGEGRFSKAYLLENPQEPAKYRVWKVQKDRYDAFLRGIGSSDVDALFLQERAHLRRLASCPGIAHEIEGVPAVEAGKAQWSEAGLSGAAVDPGAEVRESPQPPAKAARDLKSKKMTRLLLDKLAGVAGEETPEKASEEVSSPPISSETPAAAGRASEVRAQIKENRENLTRQINRQLLARLSEVGGETAEAKPNLAPAAGAGSKGEAPVERTADSAVHPEKEREVRAEKGRNPATREITRKLVARREEEERVQDVEQVLLRLAHSPKEQDGEPVRPMRVEKAQDVRPLGIDKAQDVRPLGIDKAQDAPRIDRRETPAAAADGRIPPLLFDPRTRSLLPMPCPQEGCPGKLRDCRHGAFEIQRRTTLERFLHCPKCFESSATAGESGTRKTVYCMYPGDAAWELEREFRVVGEPELSKMLASKMQNDEIRIFSFYEAHALVLELCHVPLDAAVDLLSRRPLAEVREEMGSPLRRFLPAEDTQNGSGCEYFPALAVLRDKLRLFASICESVSQFHSALKKAHRDLCPQNVMVRLETGLGGAPEFGADRFSVALIDVSGIPETLRNPCARAFLARQDSVPPEIFAVGNARLHEGRILERGGRLLLEFPESESISCLRRNDAVEVHGRRESRVCTVEDVAAGEGRVHAALAGAVRDLAGESVRFEHRPAFGPSADLFALGLLLAHVLFGRNRRLGIGENAASAVRKALHSLSGKSPNASEAEIEREIFEHLESDPEFRRYFDRRNLLWEAPQEARLPDYLWKSSLRLVFRLLTAQFREFSFYQRDLWRTQDACREEETVERHVLPELRGMLGEIDAILARSAPWQEEIAALRQRVRDCEAREKEDSHPSDRGFFRRIFGKSPSKRAPASSGN